jgi:3-methyl-2-oxobutanoate hydroxymethyltransferase
MAEKLTVAALQQMKQKGQKIAAAVCYEYQAAQILDLAGADLISVGDSLGQRFLGQPSHFEVTIDQMILMCLAVSRGVKRAVVSCDLPFGPVQEGAKEAARAAIRLAKEGHAEVVKVDGAVNNPEAVQSIAKTGIPVFAQFGFTPQTTQALGGFDKITDEMRAQFRGKLLEQAKLLEDAGASLLDLTNVGVELSHEVAKAVRIPVIGGHNTGPDTDGHITVLYGSIVGYGVEAVHDNRDRYANVGRVMFDAAKAYFDDVRSGRPVKPVAPARH